MIKISPQVILTQVSPSVYVIFLRPHKRNVLTLEFINEIRGMQDRIVNCYFKQQTSPSIVIWTAANSHSLHLSLDQSLIFNSIRCSKDGLLDKYLDSIIDILYLNYYNFGLPFLNVSYLNTFDSLLIHDFLTSLSINLLVSDNINDSHHLKGVFRSQAEFEVIHKKSIQEAKSIIEEKAKQNQFEFLLKNRLRKSEWLSLFESLCTENFIENINSEKILYDRKELDIYKDKIITHYSELLDRGKQYAK